MELTLGGRSVTRGFLCLSLSHDSLDPAQRDAEFLPQAGA